MGILFPPFAGRKVVPTAQREVVGSGRRGKVASVSEVPFFPSHPKAQYRDCSASASESPLYVTVSGQGGGSSGLGA